MASPCCRPPDGTARYFEEELALVDAEVRRLVDEIQRLADRVSRDARGARGVVATALLVGEQLTGQALMRIVEHSEARGTARTGSARV